MNRRIKSPLGESGKGGDENDLANAEGAGCTPGCTDPIEGDPVLAALVEAWPTLPEPVRAGILAMVQASMPV